ncbi:MAG: hypothetical protein P4L28_10205 [Paludibacteraceae bacterium]|nr:hypothetical protein [Paludibacteraceae bacterium]
MNKLNAKGVKILKIGHLVFAMMWIVGVMAMAIISLLKSQSGDELYATYHISRIIDNSLVIPGAMSTVITAIIYGIFTNWGFFKHKWIIVKWIVSIIVILVGTFYFSPLLDNCLEVADTKRNLALTDPTVLHDSFITTIGAFCQACILLFLIAISVIKPWKTKKLK